MAQDRGAWQALEHGNEYLVPITLRGLFDYLRTLPHRAYYFVSWVVVIRRNTFVNTCSVFLEVYILGIQHK
jgi:hypothetical protein